MSASTASSRDSSKERRSGRKRNAPVSRISNLEKARAAKLGGAKSSSSPDLTFAFPTPPPTKASRSRGRPTITEQVERRPQYSNLRRTRYEFALPPRFSEQLEWTEHYADYDETTLRSDCGDSDANIFETLENRSYDPWYYRVPGEPGADTEQDVNASEQEVWPDSDLSSEAEDEDLHRDPENVALPAPEDVLNLSQGLGEIDLSQEDLSETELKALSTSEYKIGSVKNRKLQRKRPVPPGDDFRLTAWHPEILQEALQNVTCNCPGGQPLARDIRFAPSDPSVPSISASQSVYCGKCFQTPNPPPPVEVRHPVGVKFSKQIALACVLYGIEYQQINLFFLTLGFGGVPRSTHFRLKDEMQKPIADTADDVITSNVVDAKTAALAEGHEPDSDGCLQFTASGDGTWPIRGFRSPCGVVFLVEQRTKLPIGYHVLSKVCRVKGCSSGSAAEHPCSKNYTGTSGGMETAGLKQILRHLLEKYEVKIKFYISDGDTKAYVEIMYIYNGNPVVIKLECVNHYWKRYKPAIETARKEHNTRNKELMDKGLEPVPPLPRSGLTRDLNPGSKQMKHLYRCLRAAQSDCYISQKFAYDSLQANVNAWKMAAYIDRTFHHCCDDHEKCPQEMPTYCKDVKYKLGLIKKKPEFMPKSYLKVFKPVIEKLTRFELMKKCGFGTTNNLNESMNSIPWSVTQKGKLHGPSTYWMTSGIGVIRFSEGYGGLAKIFSRAMLPLPKQLLAEYDALDTRRVLEGVKQSEKSAIRQEKYLQDLAAEIANPEYGPGFDM